MSENENSGRDDVFSKAVRAGKRTYFFDVKSTRGNDLYLTITESKRKFNDDGKHLYEKHKLFLYKEDFEKFAEGLEEALTKIRTLQEGDNEYLAPASESDYSRSDDDLESDTEEFTDVNFEDLERD